MNLLKYYNITESTMFARCQAFEATRVELMGEYQDVEDAKDVRSHFWMLDDEEIDEDEPLKEKLHSLFDAAFEACQEKYNILFPQEITPTQFYSELLELTKND